MLLLMAFAGLLATGCERVTRAAQGAAEGIGGVVSFGGGVDVDVKGPERRQLVITVPADTGDAAAIREAAASAANEYCINRCGSSEKDWARDPETGEVDFVMQGDDVAFAVKCTG